MFHASVRLDPTNTTVTRRTQNESHRIKHAENRLLLRLILYHIDSKSHTHYVEVYKTCLSLCLSIGGGYGMVSYIDFMVNYINKTAD